ncbi:23704_t:CDS:2 [Gigaspora rosea]|nr:23704_t:CDS:2 [Gigaspora rosea]
MNSSNLFCTKVQKKLYVSQFFSGMRADLAGHKLPDILTDAETTKAFDF